MSSDLLFLKRFKGIVFDLDGTLVDTMPFHINAWLETLKTFNKSVDRTWLYEHGGVPSYKIARILIEQLELPIKDEHELAKIKTDNYLKNIHLAAIYPPMKEILRFAKDHNILMAIGTGTLRSNVEYIVEHTELKNYISAIVSADEVVNHKPHPDTFLEAASRIGLSAKDCVVFEDTILGMEAAKRGKFTAVLVKDGNISEIVESI